MFTIRRDNEFIITVVNEWELMRWFAKEHSYSMHHAVTQEGYSITDSDGIAVSV